jgi:hypothetical protein
MKDAHLKRAVGKLCRTKVGETCIVCQMAGIWGMSAADNNVSAVHERGPVDFSTRISALPYRTMVSAI